MTQIKYVFAKGSGNHWTVFWSYLKRGVFRDSKKNKTKYPSQSNLLTEVAGLTPPCLKLAPQVSIAKTPLTSLNTWCLAFFFLKPQQRVKPNKRSS